MWSVYPPIYCVYTAIYAYIHSIYMYMKYALKATICIYVIHGDGKCLLINVVKRDVNRDREIAKFRLASMAREYFHACI